VLRLKCRVTGVADSAILVTQCESCSRITGGLAITISLLSQP
jgi:hypothetical protein